MLATLSVGIGGFDPGAFVWWGVSTTFLLALLYYLFGPLTRRARRLHPTARSTFLTLRNLVAVTWLCYPVWCLAGTDGFGVTGIAVETAGFAVLDLVAKLAFGYVLLSDEAVLEEAARATDETLEETARAAD